MKLIESIIVFALGVLVGSVGWSGFYKHLLIILEKINETISGL